MKIGIKGGDLGCEHAPPIAGGSCRLPVGASVLVGGCRMIHLGLTCTGRAAFVRETDFGDFSRPHAPTMATWRCPRHERMPVRGIRHAEEGRCARRHGNATRNAGRGRRSSFKRNRPSARSTPKPAASGGETAD
ncbi:hypothetical protein [Sphingomonas sp. NFX23]|uniref:hypothetical protein n=1 Tax=Sphingomonas sp. NFX23 TaxID=2819532 RepID=UPI003CF5E862